MIQNTHITNQMEKSYASKMLTKSKVFGAKYLWAIDNFSIRKEADNDKIVSPVFSWDLPIPYKRMEFCLEIYPFYQGQHVSVYLRILTENLTWNAKVKIGLIDRNGHEGVLFNSEDSQYLSRFLIGSNRFVSRSDLFNGFHKYSIINSDRLSIFCEVKTAVEVKFSNCKYNVVSKTVSEDICKLFETQKLSDFALLVDGRTILVHKAILAVRSPVFEDMLIDLLTDTKTIIEIDDFSYEAVLELVRYIYTGHVENIDAVSKELLLAAIKYKVPGLEPICCDNITSRLCTTNAADFLKFAHENQLKELKDVILNYFKVDSKAILKTEGFGILRETCPELILNELFEALAF